MKVENLKTFSKPRPRLVFRMLTRPQGARPMPRPMVARPRPRDARPRS